MEVIHPEVITIKDVIRYLCSENVDICIIAKVLKLCVSNIASYRTGHIGTPKGIEFIRINIVFV